MWKWGKWGQTMSFFFQSHCIKQREEKDEANLTPGLAFLTEAGGNNNSNSYHLLST